MVDATSIRPFSLTNQIGESDQFYQMLNSPKTNILSMRLVQNNTFFLKGCWLLLLLYICSAHLDVDRKSVV